ncbi:hypothetical protein SYK_11060 [Pseudodesulfovibrio nedwellii]|uniref:Uncharacterized protein n=1 Tax=Pseudodesulfovibrio nedwellii TaxID=2973072 RepID=A0ABN6S0M0_9BACT|nr:hypothetical protein SYK_11060 [Pseudodesulfovibrio nedwellii]
MFFAAEIKGEINHTISGCFWNKSVSFGSLFKIFNNKKSGEREECTLDEGGVDISGGVFSVFHTTVGGIKPLPFGG